MKGKICICPETWRMIVKFLPNHLIERVIKRGKIQGKFPKRKTKRHFSRKQLAAQRLFAKRARAGTLRHGRRRRRRR